MTSNRGRDAGGLLRQVRVLEVADELGEYCGKVLAGLGADVIKVEPPGGEKTRKYGPFYEDKPDPERSLHFWHYNFGKRGVVIDLDIAEGQQQFRELATTADVVLETRSRRYLMERGLGYEALVALNPGLVMARLSPFGDTGPWSDYKASDLIHLALGGVMMNTGYDPDPSGRYETPPIAPQMWQSYHVAGEMAAIGIIAALCYRRDTGKGQFLSTAVHEAVSMATETDLPDWIYGRIPHLRQTARHSNFDLTPASIYPTKDGRWIRPFMLDASGDEFGRAVALLEKYGLADDLTDEKYLDAGYRTEPLVQRHIGDVLGRFVNRFLFEREIWREAQASALVWAPERRPEDNLTDAHWRSRETFIEVEHPELGRSFTEVGAKWLCQEVPWRQGPPAPHLGEHNKPIFADMPPHVGSMMATSSERAPVLSKRGKPFPMSGTRFVDLTWILASGGAGRFLSSFGCEVIKVEHKSRWDFMRYSIAFAPEGGRRERNEAVAPIRVPRPESPNRSGFFMEANAGKRHISLNLKHQRGKELLARLLKTANVVAEGFTPGTMDRMGFGYDRLRELNPSIVYAQQSGMGQIGTYGQMRSYGPIAAGFAGLGEMSGLPEPYPPTGIGYSYLDWFGAYNLTTAIVAALYRQKLTGEGCWIDSSQVETGMYLVGTAILDYTANGRSWRRYGNRSPYKQAAPHGAFQTLGIDRWIAIACFTEEAWRGLVHVLGNPSWAHHRSFETLSSRLNHQGELERLITSETLRLDGGALMEQLQRANVPAGVCQTAQDRLETDPQLKHLEWMVELKQSEIGTWPVREFPVKFSETPSYMGGAVDRHGPNYGEDNDYVYGEILGLSSREINELKELEVI
jgi:crotonobetainyl-CoA:carnitine CoA-transferase CaiB-like acyl-CoA transferase